MGSPTSNPGQDKGPPWWVPGPPPWHAPKPVKPHNPDQQRWFVSYYGEEWEDTTLKIILNTDVEVHMWLRWTEVEPVYHVHPKMKRGREVHSDGKYCFVEHQDIEQNEPGDTLAHTFDFPGWSECLWRWWYFWATAEGEATLSNTPIYKAHGFDPRPPPFYLMSLGIYDQDETLVGNVKLEQGAGLVITRDDSHNSLVIRQA